MPPLSRLPLLHLLPQPPLAAAAAAATISCPVLPCSFAEDGGVMGTNQRRVFTVPPTPSPCEASPS